MLTEVLKIPSSELRDKEALKMRLIPAAELIKAGECVAFPTETVYGLGTLALDSEAIAKIYLAKKRPGDNPLIAHVNNLEDLKSLVQPLGELETGLIQLFSPGPITYVLKKRDFVPDALTAGLDTVAVRIPSKSIARALIALCGAPIAAPSANLSGLPSPTEAEHVFQDLNGKIPLIIDGGPCEVGLESTVLDLSDVHDIKILRPGSVTAERLIRFLESRSDFQPRYADWRERLQTPSLLEEAGKAPKAPGMKYRHYAPKTPVVVIRGENRAEKVEMFSGLLQEVSEETRLGLYVSDTLALTLLEKFSERSLNSRTLTFEESDDASIAAQHFFSALRELDGEDIDLIVVEALPHSEVGAAYMNRLEKARSHEDSATMKNADSMSDKTVFPKNGDAKSSQAGEAKKLLLFVCTGNTCRSPMAEALFNKMTVGQPPAWYAESAGLAALPSDEINPMAVRVLGEDYGIDVRAHRSRRVNLALLKAADMVLTMTEGQADVLRSLAAEYTAKIFSLAEFLTLRTGRSEFSDVQDPYGGDEAIYRMSVRQLDDMLCELIGYLEHSRS